MLVELRGDDHQTMVWPSRANPDTKEQIEPLRGEQISHRIKGASRRCVENSGLRLIWLNTPQFPALAIESSARPCRDAPKVRMERRIKLNIS